MESVHQNCHPKHTCGTDSSPWYPETKEGKQVFYKEIQVSHLIPKYVNIYLKGECNICMLDTIKEGIKVSRMTEHKQSFRQAL